MTQNALQYNKKDLKIIYWT